MGRAKRSRNAALMDAIGTTDADYDERSVDMNRRASLWWIAVLVACMAMLITPAEASGQEVVASPLSWDFGDVEIGESHTASIVITNVSVLSGVGIQSLSINHPEFYEGGCIQLIFFPGEAVGCGIVFSPSRLGEFSGTFRIVVSGSETWTFDIPVSGRGVPQDPPPHLEVAAIADLLRNAVDLGTVEGTSPHAVPTFESMLEASGDLLRDASTYAGACRQLLQVYKRSDGNPRPPDLIIGVEAPVIAARIAGLRSTIACSWP